jgi:hypothetical protein
MHNYCFLPLIRDCLDASEGCLDICYVDALFNVFETV